ncbi:DUF4079 domain-containing protein [Chlorogloea sp. CCALA 695]|uniref:DUF4079 domain-containing protein n=1 Tax=Chlorogloea sp. CCALA 695 TaxID=2107693 RepID=UPI000D076507|nr:DUF4079 domain-containing protein [Chlorogloea sp. CCALA 695]PSB30630.1 DUF4079 domain-containing protein [Chlorogloea sp. CCALA 695]
MTWILFIHPIVMAVLLGISIYALYLGIQIRRTRAATGDLKKELIRGRFNVRHHQIGSLLLALLVLSAIGGMAATYTHYGKLFVGTHLLVGLGTVGLIAVSASLSPLMQRGNNWARLTHITLNVAILALFGWQAVSGLQGVQSIIEKM